MRHMMQPFKPGDKLQNHAAPIGEVMQQLQTQLAEYQALKEQMAVGALGMTERGRESSMQSDSSDDTISTTSSSFLQPSTKNLSTTFNNVDDDFRTPQP